MRSIYHVVALAFRRLMTNPTPTSPARANKIAFGSGIKANSVPPSKVPVKVENAMASKLPLKPLARKIELCVSNPKPINAVELLE